MKCLNGAVPRVLSLLIKHLFRDCLTRIKDYILTTSRILHPTSDVLKMTFTIKYFFTT